MSQLCILPQHMNYKLKILYKSYQRGKDKSNNPSIKTENIGYQLLESGIISFQVFWIYADEQYRQIQS